VIHDVYAFEKYGLPIFQNITTSETSHILSVLRVMETYQFTWLSVTFITVNRQSLK
jgi:hypothetical protein